MARSKLRRRIHLGLAAFWLVAIAFMFLNMQARGVDDSVMESNASVEVVSDDGMIHFRPRPDAAASALAFYPGALADPIAYAPLARAIAERGYEVVIVELPLRMAFRDSDWQRVAERTRALILDDSLGRTWVVGGHSRGGALAARFARDHGSDLGGLLLVGTSHPREDDLSELTLDVTKIYASEDGLASEAEVHEFSHNLPDATHWIRVEGGNHRGFASYGWQLGDHAARIPRFEQQAVMIEAAAAQLRRIAAEVGH